MSQGYLVIYYYFLFFFLHYKLEMWSLEDKAFADRKYLMKTLSCILENVGFSVF